MNNKLERFDDNALHEFTLFITYNHLTFTNNTKLATNSKFLKQLSSEYMWQQCKIGNING